MAEQYADIIVDISHEKLDKAFQYRVPRRLQGTLETGMCVTVPFGRGNRLIKGYCVGLGENCRFDSGQIKEVADIAPKGVEVEDRLMELAAWMRRNYGSTMIQALKTVLPARQSVRKLERRRICATLGREELISLLGESERKKQTARVRLLKALLEQDSIPYEWITGKLKIAPATIRGLEAAGVLHIDTSDSYRNPVKLQADREKKLPLSPGQQEIVQSILEDYDADIRKVYLLHGITGSGKTEVYMRLIEEVVSRGRQAIVLIPEIALTYQTLLRFYRRFGDRVSVMNSTLSPGEKYDQCQRAKQGEIDVIIGPRSALFTPFPHIGLIVMDEEHEGSYKSESTPKYHARETAIEIAAMHHASVLLGSATPSLESYYRSQKGQYQLFVMKERLTGESLPRVQVVDLRKELAEGNRSIFSRRLQELLADRLSKGQQSMLFLNRRGYAGFISCRSCGHVMKCPHCDVSLSEHKDGRLWCHYCGYSEPKLFLCPECGSKYIMGFKAGTQQIEEKLKEMFPSVRTLRMDGDTTKSKESYERILAAFANEEADVLIGTQMIVKGHDFPKVTLVGVLAADLSLCAGDFRAGERTFQLLTQAVGRAGRGSIPGEAVIQTYQPEHYAVLHAAAQDYEGFYEEELLYRELAGYPPAAHMLAVQIFGKSEADTKRLAKRLADVVKCKGKEAGKIEEACIVGPAPAAIGRVNDTFRFVFYMKHSEYEALVQAKDMLEGALQRWQPKGESVQFDFDPMNTL
ncbi:MAG: primosomal protein N' [Roseburia sp.]|nr:primosomal protein N' [Roseburia sp.]